MPLPPRTRRCAASGWWRPVYVLLRFLVIVTMVAQFFNRNYESVFLCLLTLVLFLLPTIFERVLMIDLPNTLEIIILLSFLS